MLAKIMASIESSGESTPEYRTMRQCYAKLTVQLKSSIERIGDVLFSKELISEDVRDTVQMHHQKPIAKARNVVNCMMDRIKHCPTMYNTFVTILENQGPWTKIIVDDLNTCYQFLSEEVSTAQADKVLDKSTQTVSTTGSILSCDTGITSVIARRVVSSQPNPTDDKVPILPSPQQHFTLSLEKPKVSKVTHKSVDLEWTKPVGPLSDQVQHYSVVYHLEKDPNGTHQTRKTEGAEERLTIHGLAHETRYMFRLSAVLSSGSSLESDEIVVVETKLHLPEKVRSKSKLIKQKTGQQPAIYELRKKQNTIDRRRRVARLEVGEPMDRGNEKVLMVVEAAGAGKSTLINGIVNYMYGVQWEDDFRFVLVANEPQRKSQAHSQTSWITAYTLHREKESPIPYSLTIIDTPGFGDTEGIERDKQIVDQIREFFSIRPPNGVDVLHGIGFVAQASLARLSQSQQYIFDSILSIYGRDVASNIFMMITFADGQPPPVLEAIKEAKIPYKCSYKFNNSALYVGGEDGSFDAMFWQMGKKSFNHFFAAFEKAEHRTLQLTREVLNEREQLETVLKELQPQIHAGLTKMDELQRVVQMLEKDNAIIEQHKEFVYTIKVTKQRIVGTPPGHYTTNCLYCNYTCHDNCEYSNEKDKIKCSSMDGHGNCKVCPNKCIWSKHVNNPYIFELYENEEVRTSQELKDRYDAAKERELRTEKMIADIKEELGQLEMLGLDLVDRARRSLMRLDEIALKPNPLSEVDYIDQLIVSEQQQCKLGWQERVSAYKTLIKRATLMRKIKTHDPVNTESLFSYLGDGTSGRYSSTTMEVLRKPSSEKKGGSERFLSLAARLLWNPNTK